MQHLGLRAYPCHPKNSSCPILKFVASGSPTSPKMTFYKWVLGFKKNRPAIHLQCDGDSFLDKPLCLKINMQSNEYVTLSLQISPWVFENSTRSPIFKVILPINTERFKSFIIQSKFFQNPL
jgi:hypothetical protein